MLAHNNATGVLRLTIQSTGPPNARHWAASIHPARRPVTFIVSQQIMFLDLMRDKGKQMPAVQNPLAVETLRIWHCGYRTLDEVVAFENLKAITIATFPDSTFEALAALKNLRYLQVIHLPEVNDLQALAKLARLESLSLEVLPSWDSSRKRTVVTSLEPVAQISTLKHLSLFGVVPNDRSLSALEQCRSLVSARFHGYPKAEIARFFAITGVQNAHNPPFPAG